MSKTAVKYLRSSEWTMGNGQCHECEGCSPHLSHWQQQSAKLGHKRSCKLAKTLVSLGEKVEWTRKNKSPEYAAHQVHWRELMANMVTPGIKLVLESKKAT